MILSKKSLSTRVIIYLILISTFFILTYSIFEYRYSLSQDIHSIENSFDFFEESSTNLIDIPLFKKANSLIRLIKIFAPNFVEENISFFTAVEWNGFSEIEQEAILLQYRMTYLSETEVNWCPFLGTVLANDEIVNGVSERGGHPVVRKKMKQWSMRISAYAQRLLDGLEKIDWPQPLKDSQTNWIGRSQGASVSFEVLPSEESKEVRLSYQDIEALHEKRSNPTKAVSLLWGKLKKKKGCA